MSNQHFVLTPQVSTRYAPSPTGYFHIGGARTAIFNYLFAKKHHGKFILRIEDTDQSRNLADGIDSQFNNLKWMKIFPDESFNNPGVNGPYLQSQKLLVYQQYAEQLLNDNLAYRCFCSAEEIQQARALAAQNHQTPRYSRKCLHLSAAEIQAKLAANVPFVIRLKINDQATYSWHDLIRGEISMVGSSMSDYVILRSNKIPTYNFAVVIDDHDMEISHVLRGEEHIANTPYQLATFQALGWDHHPQYGHLSLIVNRDGKKLSKRDHSVQQFVEDYRNLGYLPEALVNFLALLGWAGGSENEEIMDLNTMIERFDLSQLVKSPAYFDLQKLNWINGQYLKKMDEQSYWNFVEPFFHRDLGHLNDQKPLIAALFQKQINYASELNDLAWELFADHQINFAQVVDDHWSVLSKHDDVINCALKNFPQNHEAWDLNNVRIYLKQIMAQVNKTGSSFFMPLRIAFSLKTHGPELYKVIYLLGREKCWTRLNAMHQAMTSHE